jgi:hypothetical protein
MKRYPPDMAGPSSVGRKYDGIVGRAGRELAKLARKHNVPLVNVWFSSPARDGRFVTRVLPSVA